MEKTMRIPSNKVDLVATLHLPHKRTENGKFPLVIICHGFVGSRIGVNRLFVKASREFATEGFAVLRFDYEGCGESLGEYGSYGLDHFIQQTKNVIDFAASLENVDADQITLLGHSLGGAVAALTASQDERIKKLAMWSAVGHPYHDIVRIVGEEEYKKTLSYSFVDHEGYALTKRFFDSLSLYSPLEAAKTFKGDVFLAHGTNDQDIPVDYCTLYQFAFKKGKSKSCVKELMVDEDHTFSSLQGSAHLFKSTLQWLLRHTDREVMEDNKAINL